MNFRITARPSAGAVLVCLLSACILGCRANVDYSPKKSPTSTSSSKSSRSKVKSDLPDRPKADSGSANTKSAATTASGPEAALIAYDEFDGVNRSGWKDPGLGEWGSVGVERDGALVIAGDADIYRALAQPVTDGVVWYAVTMRMESPVTGIASVDGSPGPPKRYGKLGFSAVDTPFTSRGFWMETERDTNIENTELQTFLTRYSFDAHNSEGFASRGFGTRLVDDDGMVFARPRVKMEGSFQADRLSHLSLKKTGPEKLIIERIAIARTPDAALISLAPVTAYRPGAEPPLSQREEPTETAAPKNDAVAPAEEAKDLKPEAKADQPAAPPSPADTKDGTEEAPVANVTRRRNEQQ